LLVLDHGVMLWYWPAHTVLYAKVTTPHEESQRNFTESKRQTANTLNSEL